MGKSAGIQKDNNSIVLSSIRRVEVFRSITLPTEKKEAFLEAFSEKITKCEGEDGTIVYSNDYSEDTPLQGLSGVGMRISPGREDELVRFIKSFCRKQKLHYRKH